ncbi:hypothetical protein ABZ951_28345 [Streptomyces sp. NPDC046215]|uniref:Extensin n=1 Tax=Streptomyces stramineus TaxID=173861 RepID=A0ABP3JZV8_9ACTN
MADDHRYDWLEDWLDDDAAERLLRGEPAAVGDAEPTAAPPVSPVPPPSLVSPVPPEAEPLLAALRSLTPAPAAQDGPLPGEEAALAAFRSARAASPAVSPTRVDSAGAAGSAVRLGPPAAARAVLRKWRPVKVALAMAVAGCTLGGVAVAAGTGMLPAPFGRAGGEPASSASVSALGDESAPTAGPTGGPGATPSHGRDGSPSPGGAPSASATPGAGRSPGGTGRPEAPSATPHRADTPDQNGDTGRNGKDPGKDQGSGADKGDKGDTTLTARLCRDYLAAQQRRGKSVAEDDLRVLERTLGIGRAAVTAGCERLLGGGRLTGGTGNDGDPRRTDPTRKQSRLLPPARGTAPLVLPGLLPAPGVTLSDPTAL